MQLDPGSLHRIHKRQKPPGVDLLNARPGAREYRHTAIVGVVDDVTSNMVKLVEARAVSAGRWPD
jgi:hypothetical protein